MTNLSEGRIVPHLKSVLWCSCAAALQQDVVILKVELKNTLDDEHFGCSPLCTIFFICYFHLLIISEINDADS